MANGKILEDEVNNFAGKNQRNSDRSRAQEIAFETRARKKMNKELFNDEKKYKEKLADLNRAREEKLAEKKQKQELKSLEHYQAMYDTAIDAGEKFSSGMKLSAKIAQEQIFGDGKKWYQGLANAVSHTFDQINKGIDDYIGAYSNYFTAIETRLLGSGKTFKSTSKIISDALSGNTAVTQLNVLKKLNEYVDKGIAYNVEQRAFLGEVANKIATTFDAANGTLLQLIRIQQADSTAARLGLESSLNRFFNSTFKDTSYLNGLSDSVSAALLGANSQLSRNGSLEFEYVVQKWLGSMSAVGVSDSTIQSLATGLNALGTGDVNALSGNTALQNLLVMASNRAGLDYSSILSNGLNASTANQLLSGLVGWTQSIARTNNQVVKSQYAQLFGMTVSDLTSLLNLSSNDLVSISNNMLTYSQAIDETASQLNQVSNRVMLSEKIKNAFDNVMATVGEGIANNAGLYTTYLLNSKIMEATGGGIEANIPFLGAVNLNKAVQAGVVGMSLLSRAGAILGGLSNMNKLSLDNWGAEETTGRGRGLQTTLADMAVNRTVSQTAYIGNSDESSFYQSSITSANDIQSQTVTGMAEDNTSKMADTIVDSIDPKLETIINILTGRDSISGGVVISNFPNFSNLFNIQNTENSGF